MIQVWLYRSLGLGLGKDPAGGGVGPSSGPAQPLPWVLSAHSLVLFWIWGWFEILKNVSCGILKYATCGDTRWVNGQFEG